MNRTISLLLTALLLLTICPVTAFASGEGADACLHENTGSVYLAQADEMHLWRQVCEDCGEVLDEILLDCEDGDEDLYCDLCSNAVSCMHMDISSGYECLQNGNHVLRDMCDICGEYWDVDTGVCTDTDGDLYCNVCLGRIPCNHPQMEFRVDYRYNYDGTHTEITGYVCMVAACGALLDTTQVTSSCLDYDRNDICDQCGTKNFCTHVDENSDGVCDKCYGSAPCKHTDKKQTVRIEHVANQGHVVSTQWSCVCGESAVILDAQVCSDEDADAKCDVCGAAMAACVHKNTTCYARWEGESTHVMEVYCLDCGEDIFDGSVQESCTDADLDGVCELCGNGTACEHLVMEDVIKTYAALEDGTHNVFVQNCCICGKLANEVLTEACTDENADGKCDRCKYEMTKTPVKTTVAGSNMNLGNELQVNFIVNNPVEGDYVAYIHQDTDDEGGVVYEIPGEEWEAFGTTRQKIAIRVRAMEMTDTLTLTIKDADGYDIIDAYATSVRDYAAKALTAASSTAQMKTLVVDMVNYGAAAQTNFKYKATDLANNQLTDAQKALATPGVTCVNNQIKGTNNLGANLALDDCILLNVFFSGFKTRDVAKTYAKVTFTNWKNEAKEVIIPGSEFSMYGTADRYKVTIDDIVLADAYCLVTVEVYDEGAAEPFAYGADSVESYANRGSATAAAPLYNAIMKFATSAKAYLLSRQ
ncbi:MAG: hypothetical protein J6J43_04215 [Oscillospiraceae bacterium]|nr:hypothetical protein [Oscillospiraceae bacterium]